MHESVKKELKGFVSPLYKLKRVYMKEYNNQPSFFTTQIMDKEGDVFKCTLGCYDGLIEINTKDFSYMLLDKEHLQILIELLDEVEDIERDDVEYKEWENKKENKKYIEK